MDVHLQPRAPHTSRAIPTTWAAASLFIALPFIGANVVMKLFMPDDSLRDLRNLIKALVLVVAYWGYVRFWERRPVRELSLSKAAPELLAGLGLGAVLCSSVVAILAAVGAYSVQAVGGAGDFGAVVADMLPKIAAGALIEEVVFRLLVLRLLERSFGAVSALVVSSLAFGLAHLGNAGATPLIAVLLGIELGLLFGAAYLLTRRIWLCAALHLSWNFVQGAVFAIAVSGHTAQAWLRASLAGPTWLTGGAFGIEGSVVAVMLCLAATGALLKFSCALTPRECSCP